MGESRNAYRVLVGRPAGKRHLGRPRRRREDDIKMDLREVGYDGRDWINLAQDRDQCRAYVRAAMNLRIEHGTNLNGRKLTSLRLADNIILFTESANELTKMLEDLNNVSQEADVVINLRKAKRPQRLKRKWGGHICRFNMTKWALKTMWDPRMERGTSEGHAYVGWTSSERRHVDSGPKQLNSEHPTYSLKKGG
ncbi:hypothetical protein ANN_20821 [Periplaneta americana]|uniref:Uncharacterized protein n=1 Tax=Periplaneta americana TaxID=6978 RepID=A0ABQ8SDT6_PERAM|nr:hypothetical protein ANN_20821 [Periplaneta americana]